MPEIIQDWLGTRLGVLLDMTPQRFGKNTKDGKLLAKLLYSYGVLPFQVLKKMQDCYTCYDCLENLAILKPWLIYIGVTHDNSTFEKMASGEGSAAISVFYSVYLNLERKDRLYYVSAQKQRRFSDGSCGKFQVDWVPEKKLRSLSKDIDPLMAMPLLNQRDIIDLHRAKCKEVIEKIKRTKKGFQKIKKKEAKLGPVISKSVTSRQLDKRRIEAENTIEDINDFSKKHPEPCNDLDYNQLVELKKKFQNTTCLLPTLSEAKTIINNIKKRKKGEAYAQNFQQKMQQVLLDEQWRQIMEKQDMNFEDTVCANLLKQSQYEKQMASKLHLIKHQKKVMAENRRKLECLKIEQRQKEYDELVQEKMDLRGEYYEAEEFEKERIAELHRRLYDAKVRERNIFIANESRKICEAFVDIAIRIGEIRELTGCQIPKAFMKDMKELFFKDLSIFDILDHFEELYENNRQIVNDTECFGEDGNEEFAPLDTYSEQLKCQEMERQKELNESDLKDYLELLGPWMVDLFFPDSTETEGRHLVLGYIVHKLLGLKYPTYNPRTFIKIKSMKPVVVVQGLSDETALSMLIDLMELCKILVVRVEDAINFVLLAYKEELSGVRDIDLNFQKVTSDTLKEKSPVKEKEENRKIQLLQKTSPEESVAEDEYSVADKQTQTPRMIPEDDPLLSPNAEIGKHAFESLGGGDPVPDSIVISAITAYVKSKEDEYDGWVLINYPVLYSQARELEYSLTGYYTLPIVDEMETLEDAECFEYRAPWGDSFLRNDSAFNPESRLVPKPECLVALPVDIPKTYFHRFIKMKKFSPAPYDNTLNSDSDFGPLEKFYTEQEIFLSFEYQHLDFQIVKSLGKAILSNEKDSDSLVVPKTSVEYFGYAVLELNEKWEPKKKNVRETAAGARKVVKESLNPPFIELLESVEEEEEEEVKKSVLEPSEAPKPGEPGWEWADAPQSEEYLFALASLWENMEAVYLEDFKQVFFSLRVHRSNVLGYSACIRQSIRTLMRRIDEKQKVLSDFQQMFNNLDPDLRPDVDIKCELYVRVSELEQALMSIADERKINSQRDLTKVAQDGWVPDEMANLANIYLTALQLEADRCVDSLQVIMDYYILMQQKIPDEKSLEKIIVPKLQIQNQKYFVTSGASKSTVNILSWTSDIKRGKVEQSKEKVNKTRSLLDKRKRSFEGNVLPDAAEVIMDILTRLEFPEDGLTPFHTFFIDNVEVIMNDVKNLFEACMVETKKGDKAPPNAGKAGKNGKNASEAKMPLPSLNLFAEWSTALDDEMSRFFFRVRLLLARGIFEMNEFLTTILNILSSLTDDIGEMYMREIHSISECCKVFRCSIEEEKNIQPILELKQDEFIVNMDALPSSSESVSSEDSLHNKFIFSVDQLSKLRWKLQMVAPEGEIIKRSLVYIFEDLASMNLEVSTTKFSPMLRKKDWNITSIFDKIYLNLEIVHWKDFIIYALDLPLPTDTEILNMRTNFRKYDPFITELISREFYEKVKFWFEQSLMHSLLADRFEKAKNLLFEMYQVNETQTNYSAMLLGFCKDSDPVNGFLKALTLAEGKKISLGTSRSISFVEEYLGENVYEDYTSRSSTSSEVPVKHCCPDKISLTCVPKDRIRCTCADVKESATEDRVEDEEGMAEQGGEDTNLFLDFSYDAGVSYIPLDILTSVFKASFPSLSQLSVLLDCSQTFQETLNSIYDSLEPIDGRVQVRKLIKHKFIDRLLHATNKFRFLSLSDILQSEASRGGLIMACSSDRLDITKCFKSE